MDAESHDDFFNCFFLRRSNIMVNIVEFFHYVRNFTLFFAFHFHSICFHQVPACRPASQSHSILICGETKGQKGAKRKGKM